MVEKWIQKAKPEKGKLHKKLGIDENMKIPLTLLNKINNAEIGSVVKNPTDVGVSEIKVTATLKREVNFALNVRK